MIMVGPVRSPGALQAGRANTPDSVRSTTAATSSGTSVRTSRATLRIPSGVPLRPSADAVLDLLTRLALRISSVTSLRHP